MSKQSKPKREELEFLFKLFLEGYSDGDVLTEYTRLEEEQKLKFPYRTDIRLVKQIRGEFDAARTILEPYLKAQIDPSSAKAREEHLAEIRRRIEGWEQELVKLQLVSSHIPLKYQWEWDVLFNKALQHCPTIKAKYECLEKKRNEFNKKAKEIEAELSSETPGGRLTEQVLDLKPELEQTYFRIASKYSKRKEVEGLIIDAQNLRKLEESLLEAIEISLLTKEYVTNRCDYCPR